MKLRQFWYIAAQSKDINGKKPLGVEILGQRFALYRNEHGHIAAIEDRCLHRSAQLSKGSICKGRIVCPYHGWAYNSDGQVADVPSQCREHSGLVQRQATMFPVKEQEGYVYVWLDPDYRPDHEPFHIPSFKQPGYHHIRLINSFDNTVTNCVENFVDIPHTVFVHPGIFRVRRNQALKAKVIRKNGEVQVEYQKERGNLGFFSWFLNPNDQEIEHYDRYLMPNITSVEYKIGPKRHFFITSQSIPIAERKTLVYTDLTYNYGIWNLVAAPIVRQQAQTIIDQDKVILKNQNENLMRFGKAFQNTSSDLIHVYIESIRESLEAGKDPRELPAKSKEIEFWV